MLQDEVDTECAALDRNRIFDVISGEIAAGSPISEKHKSLEFKKGGTIEMEKQHQLDLIENSVIKISAPVTVISFFSSPSSAALTPSRCSTGSGGCVLANTARSAWRRPHACSFPLVNRSA